MRSVKILSVILSVALILGIILPHSSQSAYAYETDTEAATTSDTEEVETTDVIVDDTEESNEGMLSEELVRAASVTFITVTESSSSEENISTEESTENNETTEDTTAEDTSTEDETQSTEDTGEVTLKYSTHVQSIGWQDYVNNGEVAGTTGQKKRVEALNIELTNTTALNGSIEYSAHVQSIGWQNYVNNGEVAGTTGRALRVEAIRIRLTGELADHYDVYYRAHVSKVGWLSWTSNDGIAGSSGLSKQVEALQIILVKKDANESECPNTVGQSYLKAFLDTDFTYYSHVEKIGDMKAVANANVSGTTGQKKRVEGLVLNLNQNHEGAISGNIQYRTHIQGIGWQEWKSLGQYSGTRGEKRRIEAIEVRLTGDIALLYDVYYSTHIEKYGWLGWAKNGQTAGSTGIAFRMEAFKIKLVLKDKAAPGPNTDYYKNKPPYPEMYFKAQSFTSATEWLLLVDTSLCKVGVYKGSIGNWEQVYYWDCGPGTDATPTVLGEYRVTGKGLKFGRGYTCWYYTQFYGDYLFHSSPYHKGSKTEIMDPRLGMRVSAGCVRLTIENAKWLYDNIPIYTKVYIYE